MSRSTPDVQIFPRLLDYQLLGNEFLKKCRFCFYKLWLLSHLFYKRLCPFFLLSVCLSNHLFVLSVHLSVCLYNKNRKHFVCLGTKSCFICARKSRKLTFDQSQVLDASLHLFKTLCLFIYLSVCLSFCLSVCPFVCDN